MKFNYVTTILSLGFILVVFGAVVETLAQGREMGGVGITVFKERNFRGDTATYTSDVPNLDGTGFNDEVSSIRVGPGERWQICRDANYQGRCVVVSGEENDLRRNSWNDVISSMRRISGGWNPPDQNDYIVLFTDYNYRGEPSNYSGPAPYLDRRARSITIGRGTWQLCEGTNYTGRCITLSQSSANLNSLGFANRIASARPAGSIPTQPPITQRPYIVLFSQTNYRGTPTNYNSERSNISKSTGSITIGQGVWEVCSGRNFTGRCETLSQSTSNFATFGFLNRIIRSVRPIVRQPR
jgi:hypothetical protein